MQHNANLILLIIVAMYDPPGPDAEKQNESVSPHNPYPTEGSGLPQDGISFVIGSH